MADRGRDEQQQPGSSLGRPAGKQKNPLIETDTVELDYGAEYSESTLDMLRGYQKPSYVQELEDSLDPVEDLDDHLAHGVKIPPATYEALQAAGKDEIEGLQAMRDAPIDPQQQEMVRYRQQLAEGTSGKDLKWLKMRAYYRGLEQLREERDARRAEQEAKRLGAYEVPTDKVPADALSVTALEASQRRKKQLAVAAANARRKRNQGSKQPLSSDDLELSSESQWPELVDQQQQQQQKQLSPEIRDELSEQLAAYAARRDALEAAARASEVAASSASGVQEEGARAQQQEQDWSGQRQPRTVYTDTFLEQQRLRKRVQQQQLQRTMAFWVSLAAVSGTYLIRLLRRRLRKGNKGGKGAAATERSQRGKQ